MSLLPDSRPQRAMIISLLITIGYVVFVFLVKRVFFVDNAVIDTLAWPYEWGIFFGFYFGSKDYLYLAWGLEIVLLWLILSGVLRLVLPKSR